MTKAEVKEISLGSIDDRIKWLEGNLEEFYKKYPEGTPHGFFIRIEELKKLRAMVEDRFTQVKL